MAFIKTDDTNRITAASVVYHCGDGEIEVEIPEEIDFERIHEYLYADGVFVHEPLPVPEEPKTMPTQEERITELEEALALLLSGVTE